MCSGFVDTAEIEPVCHSLKQLRLWNYTEVPEGNHTIWGIDSCFSICRQVLLWYSKAAFWNWIWSAVWQFASTLLIGMLCFLNDWQLVHFVNSRFSQDFLGIQINYLLIHLEITFPHWFIVIVYVRKLGKWFMFTI